MSTVICSACGRTCEKGAKHCAGCGARLATTDAVDPLRERLQKRTAGRYRIGERLGSGGMAAVYEATDPLDRRWAIKVLSDVLLPQRDMVERFQREARVVLRLRHPHIVQLHNFEPHDDLHFLVLEFVEGRPLGSLLHDKPQVPIDTALRWFGQLASALDYAHEQGVIHRDIKPDNILIRKNGDAVITDFGIAKVVGGTTALTQTGSAIGTAYYMSPEQWTGKNMAGPVDQYALGVVLFEALGGQKPFAGDTLQTIMMAHMTEPPLDLARLRDDVPPDLVDALGRMLAKDPGDRFPTVRDAARAAGAVKAPGEPDGQARFPAKAEVDRPDDLTSVGDSPGGEEVGSGVAAGSPPREVEAEPDDLSATEVGQGDAGSQGHTPVGSGESLVSRSDASEVGAPEQADGSDFAPMDEGRVGGRVLGPVSRFGAALHRGRSWIAGLAAGGALRGRLGERTRRGVTMAGAGVLVLVVALVGSYWFAAPGVVELRFVQGDTLEIGADGEETVVHVQGLAGVPGAVSGQLLDWISEDPGIARVEALGPDSALVVGVGEGTTEIRAAVGDRVAHLAVRVGSRETLARRIAAIRFRQGDTVVVREGTEGIMVQVEGLDVSGESVPVELSGWSSTDPGVVHVEGVESDAVRVTGVAVGSTDIQAEVGDLSARLAIRVVSEAERSDGGITSFRFEPSGDIRIETGEVREIRVEALGSEGLTRPGDRLAWSLTAEGPARLATSGDRSVTLEGVSAGATFLRVSAGEARDSVPVIVSAEEVAEVTISPRQLDLLPTETTVLSAQVRGDRDTALDRPVQWSSRDPAIVQVDGDGRAGAAAPGETYIVANAGGRTDSIRVVVGPAPEPADVSVELRVDGDRLLISTFFTMAAPTPQTFCLRGAVQVEQGPWVATSATSTTLSPASASAQTDLMVSFEELGLPMRGNVERRATPRVRLWSGSCDTPPAGDPAHTLLGGEVCLVRFAARDWMVQACDQ